MGSNVQVTLQILRALIEKSPRDLPLYAPCILNVLEVVLHSHNLPMIEDSLPTFDAFCIHQDMATLAADQHHMKKYEEVVSSYAGLGGGSPLAREKLSITVPMALRWRSVGLRAIKSITSSEALGADGGRQLNIIMPYILQNLISDNDDVLVNLQRKALVGEKAERDTAMKRRMSMATVQTVDTIQETNLASLSATTADADRVAEEEVQVVALQSLQQIFTANGKLQIRLATAAMLRFLISKTAQERSPTDRTSGSDRTGMWATTLMEMVARWTPVQDRFVILVTTMETLVRSPTVEENLEQQLILVTLVGWLLGSSINMIGLSVMDVLLGLVQHILLLLQLGGGGVRTSILPHHQQVDALKLFNDSQDVLTQQQEESPAKAASQTDETSSPSRIRQELLFRLQRCVGDLATHIYYSDQISDMVAAILARLKPSPSSIITSAAAAIERPATTAQVISESANLQENASTDEFFSFGTARVTALNAVKEVLEVANMKGSVTGAGAVGRNRVGMQVWEGTQWLLRDDDRRVRRAYVDALLAWLKLEVGKADSRVQEEKKSSPKGEHRNIANSERAASVTRRAVSNASQRHRSSRFKKSNFLQLLHLAIYDDVLESPESDSEILLLHLLVVKLTEKLGVHAVRAGLPMILRLQEDINLDSVVQGPIAKLNIGSMVHGYLWALSETFDLDTTLAGYEIQSEISRRRKLGLWIDGVRIPPLPLEEISSSAAISTMQKSALTNLYSESLKPFDSAPALVDRIAASYSAAVASPPSSPPGSPGRVFNIPILSSDAKFTVPMTHELPASFQEAMLSPWTKAACIASVEKEAARSASVNGSRSGTNRSGKNEFLGVNGIGSTEQPASGTNSPAQQPEPDEGTLLSKHQNSANIFSPNLASISPNPRHSSVQETATPTPLSSSDHQPIACVGDLKRILAGGALANAFRYSANNSHVRGSSPLRNSKTAYQDFATEKEKGALTTPKRSQPGSMSSGSESIVSAEGFESASEGDLERPMPTPQTPLDSSELAIIYSQELDHPFPQPTRPLPQPASRPQSRAHSRNRPRTSSSTSEPYEDPEANAKALKGELVVPLSPRGNTNEFDDVPPVPPLPPNITLHNNINLKTQKSLVKPMSLDMLSSEIPTKTVDRSTGGRLSGQETTDRESTSAMSGRTLRKKVDVRQLLEGVAAGDGVGTKMGGMGKPPY